MVTLSDKELKYRKLVAERKTCRKCKTKSENARLYKNPAEPGFSKYDCDEINAWAQWQNNLDARILLVGLDWGSQEFYSKQKGRDSTGPTNNNVVDLFKSIGYDVEPINEDDVYPNRCKKTKALFFTNFIQCLKPGKMQASIAEEVAEECKDFTKELIKIIKPKAVIALGELPSKKIAASFNKPFPSNWKEAVEDECGIELDSKNQIRLFPVYHCGARGVNVNRKGIELHKKDWQKIKKYLNVLQNQ